MFMWLTVILALATAIFLVKEAIGMGRSESKGISIKKRNDILFLGINAIMPILSYGIVILFERYNQPNLLFTILVLVLPFMVLGKIREPLMDKIGFKAEKQKTRG